MQMRGKLVCKHNEEIEPLLNFTDLVIILDQVTERVTVRLQREALMGTVDPLDES